MNRTYCAMRQIEKQLAGSAALNNTHLAEIMKPMTEKFMKYWKPMQEIAAVGLVLDPRYKIRYLHFSLEEDHASDEIHDFLGKVRAAILNLWAIFVPAPAASDTSTTTPSSTSANVDNDTSRFLLYMSGLTDGAASNAPGAELDLYLEERNIGITPDQNFDILGWWKMNESRFPALSKLAKVILMTPVTSVASEAAFSTGGRVRDDYRCRLNESTVEALLCAQDWLK